MGGWLTGSEMVCDLMRMDNDVTGWGPHIQHLAQVCDVAAHVLQEGVTGPRLDDITLQDQDLPHGLVQVAIRPVQLLLRMPMTSLHAQPILTPKQLKTLPTNAAADPDAASQSSSVISDP